MTHPFLENKYTNAYFGIINKAKEQKRNKKMGIKTERHHIIPKCMGGTKRIRLTIKEHRVCHRLLVAMVNEAVIKEKLKAAVFSFNPGRYKE